MLKQSTYLSWPPQVTKKSGNLAHGGMLKLCVKFGKRQLECKFLEVLVVSVALKRKFESFSRKYEI